MWVLVGRWSDDVGWGDLVLVLVVGKDYAGCCCGYV